jgi:hypothetical protein
VKKKRAKLLLVQIRVQNPWSGGAGFERRKKAPKKIWWILNPGADGDTYFDIFKPGPLDGILA